MSFGEVTAATKTTSPVFTGDAAGSRGPLFPAEPGDAGREVRDALAPIVPLLPPEAPTILVPQSEAVPAGTSVEKPGEGERESHVKRLPPDMRNLRPPADVIRTIFGTPERAVSAETQEKINALTNEIWNEPEIQALIQEFNAAVQESKVWVRESADLKLQYKIANVIRAKIGLPDTSPPSPISPRRDWWKPLVKEPSGTFPVDFRDPSHPTGPFPRSPGENPDRPLITFPPGDEDPLREADVDLDGSELPRVNRTSIHVPPPEGPDFRNIIPLPENVRQAIDRIAEKVGEMLDKPQYQDTLTLIKAEIGKTELARINKEMPDRIAAIVGQGETPPQQDPIIPRFDPDWKKLREDYGVPPGS